MKPVPDDELPDDDRQTAPPELIRALARLRQSNTRISPSVDVALLQAGKERMAFVRKKQPRPLVTWLPWSLAAAASVGFAWLVIQPSTPAGKTPPATARQEDPAAVILREFSALYPNQVKAIIQNSQGLELTLADQPDVVPGKALVLKVCQARGCEEIITFSGQDINVAGHQVVVRAENGQRVILDGEEFHWSSDFKENPEPGIHIQSRRL